MIVLFRVWMLLLLMYSSSVWAGDSDTLTPEDQFRQAVTWYKVARATENSMEAHDRAAKLYQAVIDRTDDPDLKLAAERGLDQVVFRVDNAHDTYRTLFDPIWWVFGDDSTIEWYDDVYMLAVGNSWNAVDAHLQKELDAESHIAVVYVTRNESLQRSLLDTGVEDFDFNRDYRLKLMRDEVIGFAEATPSITGMPDDLMPIVQPWIEKPALTGEDVQQIGSQLNTQGIVLIHAHIDDEIPATEDYLSVARVSLSTQFWKVGDDSPYATIKSVGVGQNAKEHHWVAGLWLLGVFIVSCLLLLKTVKDKKETDFSVVQILIVAALMYFIGGIWSHLSFSFAADYQVDWGQASLIYEDDNLQIPYIPSMQWAWVLGLVLLNGPVIILAWALSNPSLDGVVRQLIPSKEFQWPFLLPSMLAGSMAWLFLPLVVAHTAGGVWVAVLLSFAVIYSGWRLADLAGPLFAGRGDGQRLTLQVLGLMVLLSLTLPLGFFNGWHVGVALVLCIVASIVKPASIDSDVELSIPIDEDAKNPFWNFPLPQSHQEVVQSIVDSIKDSEHVQLNDSDLTRRSGILREVAKHFQSNPSERIWLNYFVCLESETEQFDFISRYLDGKTRQTSTVGGNIITSSVDSLVSSLPGVEMVMGLLGESAAGLSRDSVIKDLVDAIRLRIVASKKEQVVWIIDNAKYMDDGSLEVIRLALESIPSLKIVWEQHTDAPIFFDESTELKRLSAPKFEKVEELEDYLKSNETYTVKNLPKKLLPVIWERTKGDWSDIRFVLVNLFEQRLLQLDVENNIVPSDDLEDLVNKSLAKVLPNDFAQWEEDRINELDNSSRMLLECASICGDMFFYAEELSIALDMSMMQILELLDQLERKWEQPIVYDVLGESGIFQFGSQLTQSVLLERMQYTSTKMPRESAIYIHKSILEATRQESTMVPLQRQFYHAKQLLHLPKEEHYFIGLLPEYFEYLRMRFDWPELVSLFESQDVQDVFSKLDDTVQWSLRRLYALAVCYHPEDQYSHFSQWNLGTVKVQQPSPISNREVAIQLFADLLLDVCATSSHDEDIFSIVQTWSQHCHLPWCKVFKQYGITLLPYLPGVSKIFLNSFLIKTTEDQLVLEWIEQLRQMSESPAQQFALGSLLKLYPFFHWGWGIDRESMSVEEQKEYLSKMIQPFYEEAIPLMKHSEDWDGLAAAYGQYAKMYMDVGDLQMALSLREKDLELIQKWHLVKHTSKVLCDLSDTHRALCSIGLSQSSIDIVQCQKYLDTALKFANDAHALAVRQSTPTRFAQYHLDACKELMQKLEQEQPQVSSTSEL